MGPTARHLRCGQLLAIRSLRVRRFPFAPTTCGGANRSLSARRTFVAQDSQWNLRHLRCGWLLGTCGAAGCSAPAVRPTARHLRCGRRLASRSLRVPGFLSLRQKEGARAGFPRRPGSSIPRSENPDQEPACTCGAAGCSLFARFGGSGSEFERCGKWAVGEEFGGDLHRFWCSKSDQKANKTALLHQTCCKVEK